MKHIEDVLAKDLMTKDYLTASPEDTVSDVIGMISKHDVAEILIVEEGDVVGIVGEDTFVKKRHLPYSTKLKHIMSTPPKVDENDNIVDVCEMLLSSGYRGIPVTSGDSNYVGFISRTDIVEVIPDIAELKKSVVSDYMTPSPSTIGEDEHVGKAKAMMDKMDEKVIPVVNKHKRLSGMIGIKDILNEISRPVMREEKGEMSGEKYHPFEGVEVKSIMVTTPVTTDPNESVHNATEKMRESKISTLVALDEDKIKGILTAYDLIEMIASFRESEQVYVQITGLEETSAMYDQMYKVIQKYLKKMNQVLTPLVLNVHVVSHKKEGQETKYSIRLRLQTDHGMYYTKEYDWNIMKALDEGLENMRRKIFEDKEKKLDKYRKHPKYREE
ncbi:MAG: CBS domain-containing protein [Thermoplasmatota archaeon]